MYNILCIIYIATFFFFTFGKDIVVSPTEIRRFEIYSLSPRHGIDLFIFVETHLIYTYDTTATATTH